MGFTLTDGTGASYDFGVTDSAQGALSSGETAVNGAVVGMDANQSGAFMYYGLRLEYHDYVNELESSANVFAEENELLTASNTELQSSVSELTN
jgi:hypothetical protein